jgi:hypothetical protein
MKCEEKALFHFLSSMDRINRAIQATSDLDTVMSDVPDEVLEIFGCDRASLLDPAIPALSVLQKYPSERPGARCIGATCSLCRNSTRKAQWYRYSPLGAIFTRSRITSGNSGCWQRTSPTSSPVTAEGCGRRARSTMERLYIFRYRVQRRMHDDKERNTDDLGTFHDLLPGRQRRARPVGSWNHDLVIYLAKDHSAPVHSVRRDRRRSARLRRFGQAAGRFLRDQGSRPQVA